MFNKYPCCGSAKKIIFLLTPGRRVAGAPRFYIALAFLFFINPAAFSQAVRGELVAGFGGYYRIGKCMPVKIHLENSGPDLSGEIVVKISQTSFTRTVLLPSPSRKTFSFYIVPPKYFHDLEVKLISGGKLLKSFSSPVHRVSDGELLVVKSATLKQAESMSGLSALTGKERDVFVDTQDFPESWNDYDAVSSVFLDTSDTTRLNASQRDALSHWTALGGSVNLVSRDQMAIRSASANKSASFRTALGLGTFGGVETAAYGNEAGYQPSLMDLDEEIFKALRIREPIDRSGILWTLGVLFLLYGAAVGYCLFMPGRLRSIELSKFLAIPIVAVFFSVISPSAGRIVNGGKARIRQYSVFHILPNSPDVFTANDISVVFPRKAEWKLKPAVVFPYLVQNESETSNDTINYEFEGREVPSAVFRMDLGRIKLLSLSGFSRQGLFYTMQSAESATLVNRSPFPLRGCALIRNGETVPAGEISAGKQLRVNLQPAASGNSPGRDRTVSMLSKTIDVYETETMAETMGDCVVCEMAGSIPNLTSDSVGLSYTGSTAVVFHLGKRQSKESDQQ